MDIKSDVTIVNKSDKELFEFLTQLENFKNIMPSSLDGVELGDDHIIINKQGMPSVKMVYADRIPYRVVKLKADNQMLSVYLTCTINSISETQCETQLSFEGEVNAMMAMMIKKPIQNMLNVLSEKMTEL